jgi:hypothetical protein
MQDAQGSGELERLLAEHGGDYLPVRVYGSDETYGGAGGPTVSASVTNVQWLPPTAANFAKTLITIPAGYTQVSSPAQQ